eukprot:30200-Pelagococcus_subviridis.AAC.1
MQRVTLRRAVRPRSRRRRLSVRPPRVLPPSHRGHDRLRVLVRVSAAEPAAVAAAVVDLHVRDLDVDLQTGERLGGEVPRRRRRRRRGVDLARGGVVVVVVVVVVVIVIAIRGGGEFLREDVGRAAEPRGRDAAAARVRALSRRRGTCSSSTREEARRFAALRARVVVVAVVVAHLREDLLRVAQELVVDERAAFVVRGGGFGATTTK